MQSPSGNPGKIRPTSSPAENTPTDSAWTRYEKFVSKLQDDALATFEKKFSDYFFAWLDSAGPDATTFLAALAAKVSAPTQKTTKPTGDSPSPTESPSPLQQNAPSAKAKFQIRLRTAAVCILLASVVALTAWSQWERSDLQSTRMELARVNKTLVEAQSKLTQTQPVFGLILKAARDQEVYRVDGRLWIRMPEDKSQCRFYRYGPNLQRTGLYVPVPSIKPTN
jgi:hypothetical protein